MSFTAVFDRSKKQRSILLVTIAFTLACVIAIALAPREVHWSPDCSVKYLAVRSIRFEHGFRYDVPYLGRAIDPEMHSVPIGETYYDVKDGEIRVSWPELFPILVAPFYWLLGWYGIFVVPLFCGAASIYLTGRIAELIRPGTGWIAAAISACATPVGIYSTLLWEHTPALMLMLIAVLLALQFLEDGRWLKIGIGAAAIGLAAAGLRTDANIFFAAWAGAIFFMTRGRRRFVVPVVAGAGFVVGATPASALNWMTNGKILAANTIKNTAPPSLDYLKEIKSGILPHFFVGKLVPLPDAWAVVLGVCALAVAHYAFEGSLRRALVPAAASVVLIGSLLALIDLRETHIDRVHGFLVMSPILCVGFLLTFKDVGNLSRDRVLLVALTAGLLCAANIAALALNYPNGWTSDDNREWGPRYWLVIFPLLSVLAAVNQQALLARARGMERWALGASAASLLLISILYEAAGLSAIARGNEYHRSLKAVLERQGETPLLTDLFFVSALAPDPYFTRPSFYVLHHQVAAFQVWFQSAASQGLRTFAFAMFGDPATNLFLENPPEGWTFVVERTEAAADMRVVRVHAVPSNANAKDQ